MIDAKMKNVRHFLILAILTIAWLTSGCEAGIPTQIVGITATASQVAEEATPESATPETLTSTATAIRKATAPSETTEENATSEPSTSERPTPTATATLIPTTEQNITVVTNRNHHCLRQCSPQPWPHPQLSFPYLPWTRICKR